MDMIHIIMAITTITEIIPTTAPALKIPLITEHPLKATIAKANNNKLIFFISRLMFYPVSSPIQVEYYPTTKKALLKFY
jgi:hypothetical protein